MTGEEKKSCDPAEMVKAFREKVIGKILKIIPEDVIEHIGNSKKEVLMAIRSLIDEELKRTDEGVSQAKEKKKGL